MITWSHEAAIDEVLSYTIISYDISAQKEETDPVTGETTLVAITDLEYKQAVNEDEILPENITIEETGTTVSISGEIAAEADFVLLEYTTQSGEVVKLDQLDDLPTGAAICTMRPSTDEYKYFKWTVFSESEDISRTFTLTVRITWEAAKTTIKEKVSEITWENQ